MDWRSAPWARWLGWTLVFARGLGVWDDHLLSQLDWPWAHAGGAVMFGALTLGLVLLAFGIGVRWRMWSWVAGPLVADLLAVHEVTFAQE